jgi:hypothetical protein
MVRVQMFPAHTHVRATMVIMEMEWTVLTLTNAKTVHIPAPSMHTVQTLLAVILALVKTVSTDRAIYVGMWMNV